MTSSLVGSEMCIRDRNMVSRADVRWQVEKAERIARSAPLMAVATRSVSYTHLTLPTICSV
eukprot:1843389-Prorocentrum_lima.AAC.1